MKTIENRKAIAFIMVLTLLICVAIGTNIRSGADTNTADPGTLIGNIVNGEIKLNATYTDKDGNSLNDSQKTIFPGENLTINGAYTNETERQARVDLILPTASLEALRDDSILDRYTLTIDVSGVQTTTTLSAILDNTENRQISTGSGILETVNCYILANDLIAEASGEQGNVINATYTISCIDTQAGVAETDKVYGYENEQNQDAGKVITILAGFTGEIIPLGESL